MSVRTHLHDRWTELTSCIDTDRAVSNVVGVIVFIIIVVAAGGTIGAFVFGLGGGITSSAPQASLAVADGPDGQTGDSGQSLIQIDHTGGADLAMDEVIIEIRRPESNALVAQFSGQSGDIDTNTGEGSAFSSGGLSIVLNGQSYDTQAQFTSGDRMMIQEGSSDASSTMASGSQFRVTIKHIESGEVIGEQTITVQ
ncbi:type IV pilin [Halobaculum sp. MBLA0147]|uniref:type IV pilin n=1 Tax=Halobaculum sp. MBLA0147 TaxID=3079934 RepID=UPI003525826C